MNWEEINKIREENKDNPNYPTICWKNSDSKLLYVKIGTIEKQDITVSEAIELFKDSKLFMNELGLEKTNDVIKQLKNCCLVQKYIVEHNTYNSNIMKEKNRYSYT